MQAVRDADYQRQLAAYQDAKKQHAEIMKQRAAKQAAERKQAMKARQKAKQSSASVGVVAEHDKLNAEAEVGALAVRADRGADQGEHAR